MEKVKSFFKSRNGKLVLLVIIIIVAFVLGMEYKAYQIRSAMSEAFSGIFNPEKEKVEKVDTKLLNKLNSKITLEVLEKGFEVGTYEDYLTFTFKFTNNSGKEVQGVKGNITFSDIFGDKIKSVSISYDKGIVSGESKLYNANLDYNQFDDSEIKLKNTDLTKLKTEWRVSSIVYTDGTTEEI